MSWWIGFCIFFLFMCYAAINSKRDDSDGEQSYSGWQSVSEWAPSKFTRLSEQAAARNNELP